MTGPEPAVRHEAAHVARRTAAYAVSLMRFQPDRTPRLPDFHDRRDPLRPTWRRLAHDMQGDH